MTKRFTGRQLTTMVVAVCVTIVVAPVAALAATGTFSSSSASTPAVSATNSSASSGAKAVYGNASGTSGTTFGVYGGANSAQGYGVYSAGRLGSSGRLVCAHCVTGGDINAATFPTVPDTSKLAGHGSSYYAHIVPLSWVGTPDAGVFHGLADVGGVIVYAECYTLDTRDWVKLSVAAHADEDSGTINVFSVSAIVPWEYPSTTGPADAFGAPLSAVPQSIAVSEGAQQVEGTAIYRRNSDGRVVTINFHIFGDGCQAFGDVLTAG